MQVKIYGRPHCPYCEKAKVLAEELTHTLADFQYEYIDILQAGLDKEALSQMAGKTVNTVPQIFMDDVHIGGYTDFASLTKSLF